MACWNQHAEVVAFLLQKGADPNAVDELGMSPLDWAFAKPTDSTLAVVTSLLEAGAEPSIKFKRWYEICSRGPSYVDAVMRTFREHGWDINEKQRHRRSIWTHLHYFVQRGFTREVACLLSHGANPDIPDNRGRTPLHIAGRKGIGKEIVNLLVKHGADINTCDLKGGTPLNYAEKAKRHVVERSLKELGAKRGAI